MICESVVFYFTIVNRQNSNYCKIKLDVDKEYIVCQLLIISLKRFLFPKQSQFARFLHLVCQLYQKQQL